MEEISPRDRVLELWKCPKLTPKDPLDDFNLNEVDTNQSLCLFALSKCLVNFINNKSHNNVLFIIMQFQYNQVTFYHNNAKKCNFKFHMSRRKTVYTILKINSTFFFQRK